MWRVTDKITDEVRMYDDLDDMLDGELEVYAASEEACGVVRDLIDGLTLEEETYDAEAYLGVAVDDLGDVLYVVHADDGTCGTHRSERAAMAQFYRLEADEGIGSAYVELACQYGDEEGKTIARFRR